MMRSLVGFLVFTTVALIALTSVSCDVQGANSTDPNVPKIFDYGIYVEKFKKQYSPIETLNKAKLFFARTLKIFQHNVMFKNREKAYYLGQNQFTDLTPEELMKYSTIYHDNELGPVREAKMNPNLPASSSSTVTKLKLGNKEGFSLASLNNQVEARKTETIVNFLNGEKVGDENDLKSVIKTLETDPKIAKKMAEFIEVGEQETSAKKREVEKVDRTMKANRIRLSPVPKTTNKNYDLDSIVSYGLNHDPYESALNNYARLLMVNSDFDYNLEPYEAPKIDPTIDSSYKKPEGDISPLSALISSMKSIYDYLTLDDYDESDDTDEAPTNVEKPSEKKKLDIVYDIDWRQTGCITTPINQRDCNACYAISTLALMEFFHCRQTKQLTQFSPQYIVDCGSKTDLHGCQGGKLSNVGQFIRTYGIELAATYPFSAREGQCSIVNEKSAGYLKPQIKAWQNFPTIEAWYKWLPKSPIIVGVSMPADFFGYAGGIHDGSNCDEKNVHAMLLVGSGKQDNQEFWLLKNSYSSDWGETGYFRLSKAAPMRCFNSAVVVRPQFA